MKIEFKATPFVSENPFPRLECWDSPGPYEGEVYLFVEERVGICVKSPDPNRLGYVLHRQPYNSNVSSHLWSIIHGEVTITL